MTTVVRGGLYKKNIWWLWPPVVRPNYSRSSSSESTAVKEDEASYDKYHNKPFPGILGTSVNPPTTSICS